MGRTATNYISTVVKAGKLQETAKDTYNWNVDTKNEIEARLVS